MKKLFVLSTLVLSLVGTSVIGNIISNNNSDNNDSVIKLPTKELKLDEKVNLDSAIKGKISPVKSQILKSGDTYSIRFVSAFSVDDYDENATSIPYSKLGFNIKITDGNRVADYSYQVGEVYKNIWADGTSYSVADNNINTLFSDGNEYHYFMTYSLTDIPSSSWQSYIQVQSYLYFGEDLYSNNDRTVTVGGNILGNADMTFSNTIVNGNFETGNLDGWTFAKTGDSDSMGGVSNSTHEWWGGKFYGEGTWFYDGFHNEGAVGTLTSTPFILGNEGYISLILGGAGNPDLCYVEVLDAYTNEQIGKFTNISFNDPNTAENLIFYYGNYSQYIGRLLKIRIVDNATGGFGALTVDEVSTSLSLEEVKTRFIDACHRIRDDATDKSENIRNRNAMKEIYANNNSIQIENETIKSVYKTQYLGLEIDLVVTSVKLGETNINLTEDKYVLSEGGTYTVDYVAKLGEIELFTYSKNLILSGLNVANGGFETGDLSGWEVVEGNVQSTAVFSATTWWGDKNIPYNQGGNYHFDGWNTGIEETEGYKLKSNTFTLSGSGLISFKMGGNAARINVCLEDGTRIARYYNTLFADINFPSVLNGCRDATMNPYYADLASYVGQKVYIEIEDEVISGGWAHGFFDDINCYYPIGTDLSTRVDTVEHHYVDDNGTQHDDVIDLPWTLAVNQN